MSKTVSNKVIIPVLFLLMLIFLSACGGAAATEAPAAPAAPQQPAATEEPVEPSEQYPVQYGQDSRTELYQNTDPRLREMAASVAIFVRNSQVKISGDSVTLAGYTLNEMSEMGWLVNSTQAPMCPGELFTSQPAPGFCTGFLVQDDILVTAGHCIRAVPCSEMSVVFGFQLQPDSSLAPLTTQNIFKCTKIIADVTPTKENTFLDYAIINLDRPTGRTGLAYASEDTLGFQDNVAVIGHPSGLPMKIASNAFVMSNEKDNPFFVANLDTFGSNSGSPVVNTTTYQVEGILVRGMTDYTLSNDGSCVQVNRCPEGGSANCAGENATKMSVVANSIPEKLSTNPNNFLCSSNLLLLLIVIAFLRRKTV